MITKSSTLLFMNNQYQKKKKKRILNINQVFNLLLDILIINNHCIDNKYENDDVN